MCLKCLKLFCYCVRLVAKWLSTFQRYIYYTSCLVTGPSEADQSPSSSFNLHISIGMALIMLTKYHYFKDPRFSDLHCPWIKPTFFPKNSRIFLTAVVQVGCMQTVKNRNWKCGEKIVEIVQLTYQICILHILPIIGVDHRE